MTDIASLIGAISGCLSLVAIIYFIGYWKGQVDSFMKQVNACNDKYPPAEMGIQVRTLWDIYGVEALHKRPDLAEHGSPWRLTPKAHALIPDNIKKQLDDVLVLEKPHMGMASGWLVVKTLGQDTLDQFTTDTGLTLPEAVGLLGTYLDIQRDDMGKEVKP